MSKSTSVNSRWILLLAREPLKHSSADLSNAKDTHNNNNNNKSDIIIIIIKKSLFNTHKKDLPYYRKITLHEIKMFEINANLMEKEFRMNKINAKEDIEFHNKGN